jgi:hypothetical protein
MSCSSSSSRQDGSNSRVRRVGPTQPGSLSRRGTWRSPDVSRTGTSCSEIETPTLAYPFVQVLEHLALEGIERVNRVTRLAQVIRELVDRGTQTESRVEQDHFLTPSDRIPRRQPRCALGRCARDPDCAGRRGLCTHHDGQAPSADPGMARRGVHDVGCRRRHRGGDGVRQARIG